MGEESNLPSVAAGERCFFCSEGTPAPHREIRLRMHTNVDHQHEADKVRTTWQWTEVPVPCCEACHTKHQKCSRVFIISLVAGWILGIPLGALICGALSDYEAGRWDTGLIVGSIVGAIFLGPMVGWAVGWLAQQWVQARALGSTRPWDDCWKHPAVRALQEQGWRRGKGPQNT